MVSPASRNAKKTQVPVPESEEAFGPRPGLVKAIVLILRVAPVDKAFEMLHRPAGPQVPQELTDFAPLLPLGLALLSRLWRSSGQGWGAGFIGTSPG